MFKHTCKIRVRYSETDQMGFVYHGAYAVYLEVARVEALRELGLSYSQIEKSGIFMPVVSLELKYIRPALYDDLLTLNTIIPQLPGTRMRFEYEIMNQEGRLLTKASTVLAFIKNSDLRPVSAPFQLTEVLQSFFEESV